MAFWKRLWNSKAEKGSGNKKSHWIVLLLAGLLLMVIAMPAAKNEEGSDGGESGGEESGGEMTGAEAAASGQADYAGGLEEELAALLRQVDGAGDVEVMITLEDNGEKEVEKDETRQTSTASGENVQESSSVSEQTVYHEADDVTPYVVKENYPQIQGVCVVAEGGGNTKIKQDILQVVQALFGIDANKIVVVKMRMQEGT